MSAHTNAAKTFEAKMTTITELDTINAEAMMTLSEIGFAAYERFRDKVIKTDRGSVVRIKLKSWLSDRAHTELDLSHRIKCAPKYRVMA